MEAQRLGKMLSSKVGDGGSNFMFGRRWRSRISKETKKKVNNEDVLNVCNLGGFQVCSVCFKKTLDISKKILQNVNNEIN